MLRVTMLGAFPPQAQGIPGYCGGLVSALSEKCEVVALGFASMYPAFLFPGVKSPMDPTSPRPEGPRLSVTHRLSWYNPLGWVSAALRANTDVFHAQWWSLPLWPVTFTMMLIMRLRRKRVVLTIHNVLPHEKKGCFAHVTKVLCRLAHAIVVHGPSNLTRFHEVYGMSGKPVEEMPHGPLPATSEMPPRDHARAALNLSDDAQVVLFFGIIRPYKGLDVLLQAFKQVAEAVSHAHLVVAGRPWTDWGPYARMIDEHGLRDKVSLILDYIPAERVPCLFSAADVVALPYTHFDAHSGAAAQCVPYKKPMIVTDVGGLAESVGMDPEWIVPPRDPDRLAARLIDFFHHHEQQEAAFRKTAEKVLDSTSWSRIADRHIQLYEAH